MNQAIDAVVDEIRQLMVQYRKEIPGKRRAWPESIKVRVGRLCEFGLSAIEISDFTEISYFNVLAWISKNPHYRRGRKNPKRKEHGHFVPIRVQSEAKSISTVTVQNSPPLSSQSLKPTISTVTVTLPNGMRIDGVTPEFLASWLGRGEGS